MKLLNLNKISIKWKFREIKNCKYNLLYMFKSKSNASN